MIYHCGYANSHNGSVSQQLYPSDFNQIYPNTFARIHILYMIIYSCSWFGNLEMKYNNQTCTNSFALERATTATFIFLNLLPVWPPEGHKWFSHFLPEFICNCEIKTSLRSVYINNTVKIHNLLFQYWYDIIKQCFTRVMLGRSSDISTLNWFYGRMKVSLSSTS